MGKINYPGVDATGMTREAYYRELSEIKGELSALSTDELAKRISEYESGRNFFQRFKIIVHGGRGIRNNNQFWF